MSKNFWKRGLGSAMVLVLFFTLIHDQVSANYIYFGPQSPDDDYLYFGNDDVPRNAQNGITFSVNESSISFQSVIASITLEYVAGSTLVDQRQISQFLVLANNRIVDNFDIVWDYNTDKWRTNYQLRLAFEDWNIGSIVNLQVVAVSAREPSNHWIGYDNTYVVAWSGVQGPYQLKSLPVIDREAITVLEAILAKLSNMSAMLELKLTQLTKAVEAIYTPSPATEQRLDNAMQAIEDKLPMKELIDEIDNMNETLENSKRKLIEPGAQIKIGGDFCFIPGEPRSCFPVMDLTSWREYVLLFRKIAEAALWVYFFYMIMEKLTPKPRL